MNWTIAILVLDVQVGTLVYQRVHDIVIQPNNTQVQRTAKYSAAFVDVGTIFYQIFSGDVVFLADGEAKGRTLVFIENVKINFIHQ